MDSKKLFYFTLVCFVLGGIFFLFYTFNPTEHSFFLSCPFKHITGYYCPGCGSQRAIHQLAHGNIISALSFNPLMVLSLPVVIYGVGVKAWNYIFSTQYRVGLFSSNLFIYTFFTIVLLYWFLRNLPIAPFYTLSPVT